MDRFAIDILSSLFQSLGKGGVGVDRFSNIFGREAVTHGKGCLVDEIRSMRSNDMHP